MRKQIRIAKALLEGGASIDYIKKAPVKRTPGDVTLVGHN
jgi:hypothetical protein